VGDRGAYRPGAIGTKAPRRAVRQSRSLLQVPDRELDDRVTPVVGIEEDGVSHTARVGHGRVSMSSRLMVAKNDSATALSQHSPLRPTDRTTPFSRARSAKSLLVYCIPYRSER
jgi:hypothetical protein